MGIFNLLIIVMTWLSFELSVWMRKNIDNMVKVWNTWNVSVFNPRLSERNVIEIVTKLVELKLIEVIHTLDGKEYLTHQELAKEIQDELFVHGGRLWILYAVQGQ